MVEGSPPRVPHRASYGPAGLKQTAANRALSPDPRPGASFGLAAGLPGVVHGDDRSVILCGDAVTTIEALVRVGVRASAVVTSPPYYGQRDYGHADQYGLEVSPAAYLEHLFATFDACWPLLVEGGSLWINIGDTYWSGKGQARGAEVKQGARRFGFRPQDGPGDGVWARPKQLLLLPHRLAIGLQDRGWLARNDNIWIKPAPVPDQVRDRCAVAHEHVLHFVKSRWYYFDQEKIGRKGLDGRVMPALDTWQLPPASGRRRHRATFPEEVVRIPILGTVPLGGVVLDPFNGEGTTTDCAARWGRLGIGIDVNPEYCATAADKARRAVPPPDATREG